MSSAFGRVGKLATPSDCKSDAYSTAGSSPACPTTADSAAIGIDTPVKIRPRYLVISLWDINDLRNYLFLTFMVPAWLYPEI